MQITVDPGTGAVELAGTGKTGVGADFAINNQHDVQVVPFLRSANALPIDRGNEFISIRFTVSREHASEGEASTYCFSVSANTPNQGLVKFLTSNPTSKRYFQNGIVKVPAARQRGVRSFIEFEIIGSKFITEDELV